MRVVLTGVVRIETEYGVLDEAHLPGRQGRLLFACLVAARGRAVPRDELAEVLWGATPPPTWPKALSVLVSKLRALLGPHGIDGASALTAAFGCYRLTMPDGCWVDISVATEAARVADEAFAQGDLTRAHAAAVQVETLTRAEVLPGEDGAWVARLRSELAGVRGRALDILSAACLEQGDAHNAAGWATQLTVLDPFREAGHRSLMRAHIAAGNRAEALRVYENCRRLLAAELGADPSPETEAIYQELLGPPTRVPTTTRAATSLGPAPRQTRTPARRRLALAAVIVAAVPVVVTIVAAARTGTDVDGIVAVNSVVALTGSGTISATLPVGTRPVALSATAHDLWVANSDDQSVTRVALATHQVVLDVPVGGTPTALAATPDAVWTADTGGRMARIDPAYNRVTATRPAAIPYAYRRPPTPLLTARGALWAVDPDGWLSRIDLHSGRQLGSVDVGNGPSSIAVGSGSLWITNTEDDTVTRVDPRTLAPTTIPVGHGPVAVAVDSAGVWVADAGDSTVVRIDPFTNTVHGSTRIGSGPTAMLAAAGALWVTDGTDGTVLRLDPATAEVTRTIHLGGRPDALAFADGHVWVALAAAAPPPATSRSVARFTKQDDIESLDPALPTPLGISYATCANLVTFPDAAGEAGTRIVPEVATSVPRPTDGGRTYRFIIRPGYRFSPPSGAAVTAATFKATIERIADPVLDSPLAPAFAGVVGFQAYVSGRAAGISGIVARGNTLTITLSRPDGGFLTQLATGTACAIPVGTPAVARGLDGIPSAGPYYIASYAPRQELVLARNPNYHGSRPRHFDEIRIALGVDSSRALADIEAGRADYAVDGRVPNTAITGLDARYGPFSSAAAAGHQQYFTSLANGLRMLHMNTSRPLFSDVRLRRAVNYAIDRTALASVGQRYTLSNSFSSGPPTDDYRSPWMGGATSAAVYPLDGPDLPTARSLAGDIHATAIMYAPNDPPWLAEADLVRRELAPIGIHVVVKPFPFAELLDRVGRRNEPFDLAVMGWAFATPDPAEPLGLFDGSLIRANYNNTLSYFADADYDRELHAAQLLSGPARDRAVARLDDELRRDLVPAVPFAVDVSHDFFSARIGCQLYQPITGIDYGALCLRR